MNFFITMDSINITNTLKCFHGGQNHSFKDHECLNSDSSKTFFQQSWVFHLGQVGHDTELSRNETEMLSFAETCEKFIGGVI